MVQEATDPTTGPRRWSDGVTEGHGCDQCVTGKPTIFVSSESGNIQICERCALRWWPGRETITPVIRSGSYWK